jgi:PKD repeat protein
LPFKSKWLESPPEPSNYEPGDFLGAFVNGGELNTVPNPLYTVVSDIPYQPDWTLSTVVAMILPEEATALYYEPFPEGEGRLITLHYTSLVSPPVASFTYSPPSPFVKQLVAFDALASTPDGGIIVSYAWDFGDGATDSGVTVTHAYASAGDYTVTLTITDSDDLTATTSQPITIKQCPVTISKWIMISQKYHWWYRPRLVVGKPVMLGAFVSNIGDDNVYVQVSFVITTTTGKPVATVMSNIVYLRAHAGWWSFTMPYAYWTPSKAGTYYITAYLYYGLASPPDIPDGQSAKQSVRVGHW